MISPTRTQADFTPEYALQNSIETAAPMPPKDEAKLVRAEFGPEADINTLVNRFGPLTRLPGADDYGEFDLTQDLTDALEAAREVSTTYDRLPDYVRARISRGDYFVALSNAETIDLTKPEQKPEADSAAPAQE